MLSKQFLIHVQGRSKEELQAAIAEASKALGTHVEVDNKQGMNFAIRRRTRHRQVQSKSLYREVPAYGRMLATSLVLGVALFGAYKLYGRFSSSRAHIAPSVAIAAGATSSTPSTETSASSRRVYAYSVVPGGVHSPAEAAAIVKFDPVVAAHYDDFNANATRLVQSPAKAVYVSYRKGNKVYWTRSKITLKEGELLLSDGTQEIRTRCGNRISEKPREPVEAVSPSDSELDDYRTAQPAPAVGDANAAQSDSAAHLMVLPYCPAMDAQAAFKPHAEIPEPSTGWLCGVGLVLMLICRRRRAKA